ncbi:DUF4221 domain-containing protein [Algoriphagus yeomjeoni]|uniref:Uncharacterized protein DUF4221 n=1 Tax=Algoriphagus yeomjeoni TaxID=291403 RepID=A0A327PVZ1_9BACT|nr:DUF4221 domain-containing protein [Algoriphagus yeomjeoni]RAI95172.1 uncharacterized protein DUF4221 [Algoriphagus yeomjeoni]
MKKLLPFLSLVLLAACREKGSSESSESGNLLENLTYSVDTVVVDSGDDLFNLKWGLRWFERSADGKSLFLHDSDRSLFQEIDLEQMTLKENYPFDQDGPNGTGRVNSFQIQPDKSILIPSFQNPGIFNLQGEQIRSFNLKPNELKGAEAMNGFAILNQMRWNTRTEKLYSLPGDITTGKFEFAITDPNSQTVKILPLEEMEKSQKFRVTQIEGDGGAAFTEIYNLTQVKDNFIITCSVGSGIYLYDTSTDSLTYVDFPHKLIPKEKSGEIKNDVNSSQEWYEEYRKVIGQITYWRMNWDEGSSRFYRLASRSLLGENREDPASYEVYLLVYDEKLTLLGESRLEGYNEFPRSYFFKDGKLYSYVNVEDELGFAVFTFDF